MWSVVTGVSEDERWRVGILLVLAEQVLKFDPVLKGVLVARVVGGRNGPLRRSLILVSITPERRKNTGFENCRFCFQPVFQWLRLQSRLLHSRSAAEVLA